MPLLLSSFWASFSWSNVWAALSAIGTIGAVLFAWRQVEALVQQIKASDDATKAAQGSQQLEATIRYFTDTSERTDELTRALVGSRGIKPNTPMGKEAIKACAEFKDMHFEIIALLSVWENVAVGVKHGAFSMAMVDSLMGGTLLAWYVTLKPYIDHYRMESGSLRYFDHYEWLAKELGKPASERISS